MASNYETICGENRRRYGTDIGRIGPILLADRYDDRTHFIFELLQNAEDALSRCGDRNGVRQITFELTTTSLTLSHFGKPFDEDDVRGVCGIAESTKDKSSIGRFGIGFKSVYTFTDRPEIHSGDEDFVIENYVLPKRAEEMARAPQETLIVLPLKSEDETAQQEITIGLRQLGPSALLFLRHIDEINWSVQGGPSGIYLRSEPDQLAPNVQRITVIGQESGQPDVDQSWLIFHKDVIPNEGDGNGRVEIAFSIHSVKDSTCRILVQPVHSSPLVVFFPTVVSTNLGFLVQGPYRTTPSRDNIPRGEPWNQHLVEQTTSLLVQAMRWFRDNKLLDTSVLRCLPIDREKFPKGSMFAPLFDAVRAVLIKEELLPRFDGGYIAATQAKLARTQELRELFNSAQVTSLFDSETSAWLSGEITVDREPEIRKYLMRELEVVEVTPAALVQRLNKVFLEAQPDGWIVRLYEFLIGQNTLRHLLDRIPLIRLTDGSHIVARENGKAKAFLPSSIETGFPTVRPAVCASAEVRSFLNSLGITEPDPVDDVIQNILHKYRKNEVDLHDDVYATDIERIRQAFNTDSKTQRDKLLAELREVSFVMVVDACGGKDSIAKPGDTYLATARLKQLFAGVPGILIVNDRYDCLRGESMRELLEACGSVRCPRPKEDPSALTREERAELRRQTGYETTSGIKDRVEDRVLQGFSDLIALLPKLAPKQRAERARLIWESLGDLEERRGQSIFYGSYSWSHYGDRKTPPFPAAFLRHLKKASWVPDANGDLVPPNLVVFDSLGWKSNPFLLTQLAFKPPILDQLAKEAGIDPAVLDLLRKQGITSVADLTSRLGISSPQPEAEAEPNPGTNSEANGSSDGPPGMGEPGGGGYSMKGARRGSGQGRAGTGNSPHGGQGDGEAQGGSGEHTNRGVEAGDGQRKRSPGQRGGRPFISYVGVHPDDEEPDPDGLDRANRMQIEDQAIQLIIGLEPKLHRTPEGNPGFDLYEVDNNGKQVRWVEVKSMMGSLNDRPVGLSHTQFDCAREHGAAYWVYVVEYATTPGEARVLRIQDPVAQAKTFTFDRGWSQIAQSEPPN